MRSFFFFISVFGFHFLYAQGPVRLTDMLNIKTVGNPALSADGKTAFFTLSSIEGETDKKWEYQYKSQIWSVLVDGSASPKQLTGGKESASQMALSPTTNQLLFVRAVEGKPQLFLMSLDGGEAIQLTSNKYGASGPQWSPDGKTIAFSSSVPWKDLANDSATNRTIGLPLWATEKPGMDNKFLLNEKTSPDPDGNLAAARAWLQLNEKDKKAKVINRLDFQEESGTTGDISIGQIYLIASMPGAQPKLISPGFNSYSNPQFLGNGTILVTGEADQTLHPDKNLAAAIYSLDTSGAVAKPFLLKEGYNYSVAAVSKSGKWIAITEGVTGYVAIPQLSIIPASGAVKDIVAIPFDRNKSNLVWKGDDALYGLAQSNGGAIIFQYDVKSKKLTTMGGFDQGIYSLAIGNGKLLYSKTSVPDPSALYATDLAVKNEKALTRFNQDWLQQRTIILPEKHVFKNEKGLEVEYWVMKPADFAPGKKYPLLLEIHGGPAAMWGPGESSMWHEFQYWCGKGYGVVYSNPRGSGGYGQEFLNANINDWGKGPMEDVLASLDKAVAEGWADTSRLFLTGGSYAGYLGAYILGHDNRFRAACSQRGVYDLRTFFGEGNAWRLIPNYFGGYPWEPKVQQTLERESPISYVQNIQTPYIIFHGENDLRTGVIQSEQLYKSLKQLNRPVEYVRHPGATHEITRSGNNRQRMDQLLRTWEFFERYR